MKLRGGLAIAAIGLGSVPIACGGDAGTYVYLARSYDAATDCLGSTVAVDALSGAEPGVGCAPRCLISRAADAAASVYATTMCGAPPPGLDASEGDPRCAAAKAALSRGDVCTADGGHPHPRDAAAADAPAE